MRPGLEPPEGIWKEMESVCWPPGSNHKACRAWTHKIVPGLNVLRSLAETENGEKWIHVSLSRRDRMPEWVEIRKVKDHFLGDIEAYQVLPKKQDYVNVHNFCLHLWAPVDGLPRVANLQGLMKETAV